jgi:sugar O-acyltransferase (sialic acid O-acetyltransferase NeuD family)
MKIPLLILGSKGASKEAYYIAKDINLKNPIYDILGFVEVSEELVGTEVTDGKKVITSDESLSGFISGMQKVAVVVPFGGPDVKAKAFEKIKENKNVYFPNLVHPSAITSNLKIGIGNIISPRVVFACDSVIGDFNLINRCSTLGHDLVMGDFNSICPGAVISGCVEIENMCNVGANATVLQGLRLNSNTVIGAGAVVTKDTTGFETLIGIPAKRMNNDK